MTRLIVKSPYIKCGDAGGYLRYILVPKEELIAWIKENTNRTK